MQRAAGTAHLAAAGRQGEGEQVSSPRQAARGVAGISEPKAVRGRGDRLAIDFLPDDAALRARCEAAAFYRGLRFFAGLSNEEVAAVQGVSLRTVTRQCPVARIWLLAELGGSAGGVRDGDAD